MQSAEFVQLLSSHQSRIYAYLLSLVFDREEVDNLLQQTNTVLWSKADQFTPGTNFAAWALRIAYLEVMRYRRKRHRERLVFNGDLVDRLADIAQEEDGRFLERHRMLRQCLDEMTEHHRDIVRRRYLIGADMSKLARELGSTVAAVKQMLFRAREALRACVDGKLEAEA